MLKRFSALLLLIFVIPFLTNAQDKPQRYEIAYKQKKFITGEENTIVKAIDYSAVNSIFPNPTTITGKVVGYTFYDYMTNGPIGRGYIRWSDGTGACVLMAANDSTSGTTQRGSYYNFYKNGNWKDTTGFWRRIQTARRGWGRIGAFSDRTVFTIAHGGFEINQNTGSWDNPSWSSATIPNSSSYTWPKLALDDDGSSYYGIWFCAGISGGNAALNVFGSTDAGATWGVNNVSLQSWVTATDTALISAGYMGWGSEDYGVSAAKGKVAFAGFKTNGNVYTLWSTNKGTSWTYKKVYDGAKVDTTLATIPFDSSFFPAKRVKMLGIPYCDGSGDVLVDKQGVVHLAWGSNELGYRINVDTLGNPVRDPQGKLQRTFFVTDYSSTGIWYWNSNFTGNPVQAVKPNTTMMDSSLATFDKVTHVPAGINAGMDMALLGMPSLSANASGNAVYITFQGFKAKDTASLNGTDRMPYGHVYIAGSRNGGTSWGLPRDVVSSTVVKEDVCFPQAADLADSKVYFIVTNDNAPGNWLQNGALGHPQNKVFFIQSSVDSAVVGVNDNNIADFSYELYQNYPNPFNPTTSIKYSLPFKSNVTLKVYDVLGREVAQLVNQAQDAGIHTVNFDATKFASGVYIYSLNAGNFTSSKKMLILK